jgi:hypothetical protein
MNEEYFIEGFSSSRRKSYAKMQNLPENQKFSQAVEGVGVSLPYQFCA